MRSVIDTKQKHNIDQVAGRINNITRRSKCWGDFLTIVTFNIWKKRNFTYKRGEKSNKKIVYKNIMKTDGCTFKKSAFKKRHNNSISAKNKTATTLIFQKYDLTVTQLRRRKSEEI